MMYGMRNTGAILAALVLGGCGIYSSGDDDPIDPTLSVEGSWEMRVSLAPCVIAPAPVTVTFEIQAGELLNFRIAGETVDSSGYLSDEQVIWAETVDDDGWDITLWDDGEVAGAIIEWRSGGCDLETGPDSIVRVRPE